MLSQFEIWDWENEIFGHVWFFSGDSYVSIVCEIASIMCAKPKDGGGNVFIIMILYPDASALVSHACKTRHLHQCSFTQSLFVSVHLPFLPTQTLLLRY